jgi:hypothetical protein
MLHARLGGTAGVADVTAGAVLFVSNFQIILMSITKFSYSATPIPPNPQPC